jgi:tetratricopeptide (TPR) repeat protein
MSNRGIVFWFAAAIVTSMTVPAWAQQDQPAAAALEPGGLFHDWHDLKPGSYSGQFENYLRQWPSDAVQHELKADPQLASPPPTTAPAAPAGTAPPDLSPQIVDMQDPIDNLFHAWRELDLETYLAQWAADAVKYDLRDNTSISISELRDERQRDFGGIEKVDVRYRPTFQGFQDGIGRFDVVYNMTILSRNGDTSTDNACESYKVRRDGERWVIVENQDYKPCCDTSAEARETDVSAYTEGNKCFAADDFEQAEASYSAAIRIRSDASYSLARGHARLALMQYAEAMEDYDRAIEQKPGYAPSYLARGTLSWLLGSVADAERDFRAAAKLAPEDDFYYQRVAAVLNEQDRRWETADLYRRAFEEDQSRAWALGGWLLSLLEQKEYDQILQAVSRYRPQNRYLGLLAYYSGFAHEKRDQPQDALRDYRSALQTDAEDLVPMVIYRNLAYLERDWGLTADCIKYFKEFKDRMGRPEWDESKECRRQ